MGTLLWFVVVLLAPRDAASSMEVLSNTTVVVRGFINRIMNSETTANLIIEVRNKNKNQSISESILNPHLIHRGGGVHYFPI